MCRLALSSLTSPEGRVLGSILGAGTASTRFLWFPSISGKAEVDIGSWPVDRWQAKFRNTIPWVSTSWGSQRERRSRKSSPFLECERNLRARNAERESSAAKESTSLRSGFSFSFLDNLLAAFLCRCENARDKHKIQYNVL